MLRRSTETPSRFSVGQSALWLSASEFHWGSSTIALFPFAGNQRALARLFSGYGVGTGEVNRRKCAYLPRTFASSAGSGTARVLKTWTSRRSRRKSVGVL